MAIGIAEAIGQQGELRLPTRSVAASRSPLAALGNKGKGGTQRDLTGAIAQKLLTFSKPVLPGDEEQRTNNAVSLVSEMYQKQSSDPNYNPLSDPDFVKKFSDFRVSENRMQDLYRSVAADAEQRQVLGEKAMDNYDLGVLMNGTGDEFQKYKELYTKGNKPFSLDVTATNPWVNALGTELKMNNVEVEYYVGRTKKSEKGFDPTEKNAQQFANDQIETWLKSGSLESKAALQDSRKRLIAANPQFDYTSPQGQQQVVDNAKSMVYDQYVRSFPLKKGIVKSFGYSGRGGLGGTTTGGTYEFSKDFEEVSYIPGKKVRIIAPSGKPTKSVNLTDNNGMQRGEVEIQSIYVDENDNVVGYKGQYRKGAKNKTGYFPADKNPVDAPAVLPSLKEEYKAKYGVDLNTESETKKMEGKGKVQNTNRFIPDFLNDAIKNIGDFLRPPVPQPPPVQGPDVTGMV